MTKRSTWQVPRRKLLQRMAKRGDKKAQRELAQLNKSEAKQTAQELRKLKKQEGR